MTYFTAGGKSNVSDHSGLILTPVVLSAGTASKYVVINKMTVSFCSIDFALILV